MRSLYKNTSNTFSSFSSHFRSFLSSFCVLLPVPLLALPLVSVVPNHRTLFLVGLEHFFACFCGKLLIVPKNINLCLRVHPLPVLLLRPVLVPLSLCQLLLPEKKEYPRKIRPKLKYENFRLPT